MQRFEDVFGKYIEKNCYNSPLRESEVVGLQIATEDNAIRVALSSPCIIPYSAIAEAQRILSMNLSARSVAISARYPSELLGPEAFSLVIDYLKAANVPVNGFFRRAEIAYDNGNFMVKLPEQTVTFLEPLALPGKIAAQTEVLFGIRPHVSFIPVPDYELKLPEQTPVVADDYIPEIPPIPEEAPPWEDATPLSKPLQEEGAFAPAAPKTSSKPRAPKREKADTPYEESSKKPVGNYRLIKGSPMPISNLALDTGSAVIWGDVFSTESRITRDNNHFIMSIAITDYTGSINLKIFDEIGNKAKLEAISVGDTILIQGDISYDKYDRDMVMRPRNINTVKKNIITDDAPVKRVELHLHTTMSAMDAVTPAEQLVYRAHEWGHPAIAITDHGVVQAFPEVMNAVDKIRKDDPEFKAIYGVEGYFINDMLPAVKGQTDAVIDGRYIVFDLETTGLSNASERIIEIGAVKVENGQIIDSFDTFVDPEKAISPEITRLTSITNEMVAGAPTESEALEQFFHFCDGCDIFVAHNADFDMGFLRTAIRRCGREEDPVQIDTLVMGRAMYPELRKHKLDTLAEHMGVEQKHHHRADDDARVLAEIFLKMLDELVKEHLYCMHDAMKNVTSLFGEARGRRALYEYRPYGGLVTSEGNMAQENKFRFSSEYMDDELGLIYYNYRHLNPRDGRWISRDPIMEQGGWNLYSYIYNSPTISNDIIGLYTVSYEVNLGVIGAPFYAKIQGEIQTNPYFKVSGEFYAAWQWTIPGVKKIDKLASKYLGIHFDAGIRVGTKAKISYSGCKKLSNIKVCGSAEAFSVIEYRRRGYRNKSTGRFNRQRFGINASGSGDLCLNLCNGDISLQANISWSAYVNIGVLGFNKTISGGGNYSFPEKNLVTIPSLAILKKYCNS